MFQTSVGSGQDGVAPTRSEILSPGLDQPEALLSGAECGKTA